MPELDISLDISLDVSLNAALDVALDAEPDVGSVVTCVDILPFVIVEVKTIPLENVVVTVPANVFTSANVTVTEPPSLIVTIESDVSSPLL